MGLGVLGLPDWRLGGSRPLPPQRWAGPLCPLPPAGCGALFLVGDAPTPVVPCPPWGHPAPASALGWVPLPFASLALWLPLFHLTPGDLPVAALLSFTPFLRLFLPPSGLSSPPGSAPLVHE